MKVIVIPNYPETSGRHYFIAKNLVKQGHDVHYFMWELPYKITFKNLVKHFFTSLLSHQYKYEQFIVHKAVRLPFFWPVINGWIFKIQLRNLFREINADIIFTESYTNETEVPKDLPFIYDLADDYAAPADIYGSPIYKLAFKLLGVKKVMKSQCKNSLAVTAVSETLFNYAKQFNLNVIKLPNGVDTEIIKKIKKGKTKFLKNNYSMVYVTGFGEWSRAIETLNVVKKLKKEFPKLELTLIGKGIEVDNIKKFIKDNKAENYIHYMGFIYDRKNLFSLINKSAIGLNISDKNKWRDAAHPIKILEYCALGKKVISTNLDEVKKLNLPNVFLFSDKNRNQNLETVMRSVLLNKTYYNPNQISNQILKDYNWEHIVKKIIRISPMKNINSIVHVTPSYPPALGGLEKVVQALAHNQKLSGMKVSVITSNQNPKNATEIEKFRVIRLKKIILASTRIMPKLPIELLKLKSNDIVHLHITSAYMPEIVWLVSKIKGFRYIAHLHLNLEPTSHAGILLKLYKPFVLKYVLKSAGFVIVFTEEQRQKVHKEYNINIAQIAVIPNGVERKYYLKKQRTLHKKPRILFVGRLEKQKNIQQLLHALKGISEKFDTFLVGEGSLLNELINLTNQLDLTGINFVGRADGNKLLKYYKQSDIFVFPSEREGMPLALLEACAMGMPIATTKVIGNKDIVKNNINGFLVPFNNSKELQKSILKISSDKNRYLRFSQNSKEISKEFSWEKIVYQFTKIYEKTI